MKLFLRSLAFLVVMTLITGVAYPLAVTCIARVAFPQQARGSIIEVNGKKYGSELLAQAFTGNNHLWGRPMNVDTVTFKDENGTPLMYGWPSNLSPAGEGYARIVAGRAASIRAAHPDQAGRPVPVDLVTVSGSGLDPHISVAAARYQAGRLARHTGLSEKRVLDIIDRFTEGRFLGLFGEPRVNVLKVNLALDGVLQ